MTMPELKRIEDAVCQALEDGQHIIDYDDNDNPIFNAGKLDGGSYCGECADMLKKSLDDIKVVQTRLERYEKALRFYAEKENYIPDIVLDCGITEDHISNVTQDAGTIAREALSTESSEVTDAEVRG